MPNAQIVNPITKERLRTIGNTHTYANSVNVYVGRPRSGKTYLALHDIISVIRNDETVHLVVYINESGQCDDDTFNRFQELITVPIVRSGKPIPTDNPNSGADVLIEYDVL